MKAQLFGKNNLQKGSSTLEILIAFAILVLTISAVIGVVFGNQSVSVDTQVNNEAIYRAQKILEDARAASRNNFLSINSTSSSENNGITYQKSLSVTDLSQCQKQATSTVQWTTGTRTLKVEISTLLGDIAGALALGGDCVINPPTGGWNPPKLFARDTIGGKINVLDALQKIVYMGSENSTPYLFIADTRSAVFNDHSDQPLIIGDSVPFNNSFNSDGKTINAINDIDAFKDNSTGKTYVFLAMASSTAQLAVVDVTDMRNPSLVAIRRLKNITASNSTAWGWRLYYYDGKLYINSRETAGPEFHVFNVSGLLTNPSNPRPADPSADELGSGSQLTGGIGTNGTTIEDFVIRDGLGYFAVKKDTKELLVYDVSDPSSIQHISGASRDLPGNEDGRSIYLLGNTLYFGRDEAGSGPEFYIFDVSNVRTITGGLPIFGVGDSNKEMDKDITDVRVIGRFAFLASYGDSAQGFKVWDISNPENISSVGFINFGNKLRAIDYENDFIYAASEATPNFQMLYGQ